MGKTFQQHLQLVLPRQGKGEDKTMQTFLHKEILIPSHRISLEGIARGQVKVDGVSKWPLPKTVNIYRGSWDWWAPIHVGDLEVTFLVLLTPAPTDKY